jgi:transcriptional regulator with XRE-family HTH domain
MNLKDKLKDITSENKSTWLEDAEKNVANQGARKNARRVALRVLHILKERGMTQQALADKMDVSRQQVTKIIKGKENFTFETIDKLEKALNITLLNVPLDEPTYDPSHLSAVIPIQGSIQVRTIIGNSFDLAQTFSLKLDIGALEKSDEFGSDLIMGRHHGHPTCVFYNQLKEHSLSTLMFNGFLLEGQELLKPSQQFKIIAKEAFERCPS